MSHSTVLFTCLSDIGSSLILLTVKNEVAIPFMKLQQHGNGLVRFRYKTRFYKGLWCDGHIYSDQDMVMVIEK